MSLMTLLRLLATLEKELSRFAYVVALLYRALIASARRIIPRISPMTSV